MRKDLRDEMLRAQLNEAGGMLGVTLPLGTVFYFALGGPLLGGALCLAHIIALLVVGWLSAR